MLRLVSWRIAPTRLIEAVGVKGRALASPAYYSDSSVPGVKGRALASPAYMTSPGVKGRALASPAYYATPGVKGRTMSTGYSGLNYQGGVKGGSVYAPAPQPSFSADDAQVALYASPGVKGRLRAAGSAEDPMVIQTGVRGVRASPQLFETVCAQRKKVGSCRGAFPRYW